MKKYYFNKILLLLLLSLLCNVSFASKAKDIKSPDKNQLRLVFADGPVFFNKADGSDWYPVTIQQTLKNLESLRTADHGYAILAWSNNNLIFVNPNSAIRLIGECKTVFELEVKLYRGSIMLVSRDSGLIEVQGDYGGASINHGEFSFTKTSEQETLKSMKGELAYRNEKESSTTAIPENYFLSILPNGTTQPISMFDIDLEYLSFRRFGGWLKDFDEQHRRNSLEIPYKLTDIRINRNFLAQLQQDENSHYIIETKSGKLPDKIYFQAKIEPYPAPHDRFELYLSKDLSYALREGRDGYFEVTFAPPSFPDFYASIFAIDSLERGVRIFNAGFNILNKRDQIVFAKSFCEDFVKAFERRSQTELRDLISANYRDWQGNTFLDFVKMSEDTLRDYRDIRFILHPFRFEVIEGNVVVHLNYMLSAISRDWRFRHEEKGAEIFTLKRENNKLKLVSKTSGMFFSTMKVAVDLRRGIIQGRVTDNVSGRPVDAVHVKVRGTRYFGNTDKSGQYTIYNVPPGEYELEFSKNGFANITATKVVVRPAGDRF